MNNLEDKFDLYLSRKDSKGKPKQSDISEKNVNYTTNIQSNHPFSEREITLREEEKFTDSLKKIFLFQELSDEIL